MIPSTSDRVQWDPTVGAGYVLVPTTIRRVSPRGSVDTPVDRVLLGGNWDDNSLGTCQHRDQPADCPAGTPILHISFSMMFWNIPSLFLYDVSR